MVLLKVIPTYPTKILKKFENFIGDELEEVICSYEKAFAKLIDGEALSYASGRMVFYEVLRHLSLQKNDEIILLGFTCSVMVNAVLRAGLTPVFSDIDPDTFGLPFSIGKTDNTKYKSYTRSTFIRYTMSN